MTNLNMETTRNLNGGAKYRCKVCGYTSTSYWKTYANALACVTRKYGLAVFKAATWIFG